MARNQFVDALKLFLDTADPGDLDNLALRLKPYRITSLQVQRPGGAPSARSIPVIVLDDGRKTPEPTPTLQQHLDSLLAASDPVSMPIPALTLPLDSFIDVTSLPWLSTDPSCLTAPGSTEIPFEDMILDENQLGDLCSEFSMSGAPGYYQDPRIPITPPSTDFFESAAAPSSLPSNPFGPSTFLDTPMATPSPSSDLGDYLNTPTQANTPTSSAPETPVSSPKATNSNTRSHGQAKIHRRRKNNPSRPRKGHTAASITQAILSSSASASSSLSHSQPPGPPNPATAALVFSNCIRKDYLDFLRTNLPEWVREGLWRSSSPLSNSNSNSNKTPGSGNDRPYFMKMDNTNASASYSRRTSQSSSTSTSSTYGFLENIYSCVSQLDSRIETDQVRKRVALVLLHSEYLESYQDWKATRQGLSSSSCCSSSSSSSSNGGLPLPGIGNVKGGVGRGDMTLMIDNILEQTTPGWDGLSPKKKLQLRALFHERKRYGKRWAVFREEVGCAILLVCSGQLGNMVSNTKVTMAALKQIAHAIRDSAAIMEVLSLLEPLAAALVNNDGYKAFGDSSNIRGRVGLGCSNGAVGNMIQQFEYLQARRGTFEAGCGGDRAESCSDDEDMD